MHIYMLGFHWKHPADFRIERPNGHFGMQLILVQSKARIQMGEQEFLVEPNTAFLVQSCLPHALFAVGEEYMDDWIRFSPEQDDHAFLNQLDLEWNAPIPLPDDTVSHLIAAGDALIHSEMPQKNRMLHHIMMSILLYLQDVSCPKTERKHNYYDSNLEAIRRKIYENPGEDWSIQKIAESLCISVSHFQRLYKARFGVSCSNDIFMSRMEYAKQLLLETALPASEIALKCGYQNYEYFSRSFSKYACMPPARYRHLHQK
ncbi:MAG TPA: AraC family transcriptional regulator [Ruminococcus sp.]|nr:AraC family transcriptional regulator [Ruminococcus sp.]